MIVSSDIEDMIIPDELLVIGTICIMLLQIPAYGIGYAFSHFIQGIGAFFFMVGMQLQKNQIEKIQRVHRKK